MPKYLTLVVYKPDSQSTDEYMVYVDPLQVRGVNLCLVDIRINLLFRSQYRKWKEGGECTHHGSERPSSQFRCRHVNLTFYTVF